MEMHISCRRIGFVRLPLYASICLCSFVGIDAWGRYRIAGFCHNIHHKGSKSFTALTRQLAATAKARYIRPRPAQCHQVPTRTLKP
ncbi:hypothetical protein CKAH01_12124 [Colletotrichum kahawae]|uniref:Uncharacterized protein n=1 Tax=Colletotrichum kahawae TaxID=34407 RepID=A0AAD9YV47_COLKA|nr:hypothetical protein CKAH01_12124 [Colletotrichum kahawae]